MAVHRGGLHVGPGAAGEFVGVDVLKLAALRYDDFDLQIKTRFNLHPLDTKRKWQTKALSTPLGWAASLP